MSKQLSIRSMRLEDNGAVERIIKTVMPEFGCVGEGYSIEDPEVADMFSAYSGEKSCFYVIVNKEDEPIGCGGVAPLDGSDGTVCELKKMYFLQEARGHGFGRKLIDLLIADARKFGYEQIYLETVERMVGANALYRKTGFKLLEGNMGCTGHSGCDSFYAMDLK